MAAISVTVTAVKRADSASSEVVGKWGATVTAGQVVYEDSANPGTFLLTKCDATGTAKVAGVALNGGSTGQEALVLKQGNLTLNAVLTVGAGYWASAAAAGSIIPESDYVSTNWPVFLGVATSTTNLYLMPYAPGVQKA
jgi:hypothetical protein